MRPRHPGEDNGRGEAKHPEPELRNQDLEAPSNFEGVELSLGLVRQVLRSASAVHTTTTWQPHGQRCSDPCLRPHRPALRRKLGRTTDGNPMGMLTLR